LANIPVASVRRFRKVAVRASQSGHKMSPARPFFSFCRTVGGVLPFVVFIALFGGLTAMLTLFSHRGPGYCIGAKPSARVCFDDTSAFPKTARSINAIVHTH
jgi:hypothetical protein